MDKNWEILNEPQKCHWTGKLYDATRKVKCPCSCHTDMNILHFGPCCNDGYTTEFRYI